MTKNPKRNQRYLWIGVTPNGLKCQGELTASHKKIVKNTLKNRGIVVLQVKRKYDLRSPFKNRFFSELKQLQFTESLLWLLESGISISDALQSMAKINKNKAHKDMLNAICEKILAGHSFSQAIADFPAQFHNTYRQLIAIGEKCGQLETVLKQIIQHQNQHITLKRKISNAMIYPMSVLSIAIMISIGLLLFVVPQFQKIYASFNAQLPATTQLFISLSQELAHYFWALLLLIPLIFCIFKFYFTKNEFWQLYFSKILLKIPFLRAWLTLTTLTQWSQLFYTLINTDIPLLEALLLSQQTITCILFNRELDQAIDAIRAGQSFTEAITPMSMIPHEAKQLIYIAENIDSLPQALHKIASLYHEQLNRQIDHLSKFIEPVIMILLASGIAALIIAMYLPVFRMGSIM